MSTETQFPPNCPIFSRLSTLCVTVAQNLDVLNTEVNNIRKEIKAIGNSHPISNSQLNKFAQKLRNRTIVVIGDSLSQQVLNFMENVVRQKSNCPEKWILFDFWGIKAGQDCTDRSGFNPKYLECKNEILDTFTKFVFLPHGKPIHHGGCSRERMPWMIDSVARIEKHADLNDRTVIILGPGAHFSAANPVYLFNRLLELKPVLIQFKKAHPEVKIIFKTPNYFPGDFYEQKAVISAFNAKRIEDIILKVFSDDSGLFEIVSLYDKTEVIFDQFERSAKGIHTGSDGGAKWVLNEIVDWLIAKF